MCFPGCVCVSASFVSLYPKKCALVSLAIPSLPCISFSLFSAHVPGSVMRPYPLVVPLNNVTILMHVCLSLFPVSLCTELVYAHFLSHIMTAHH